MSGPEFLKPAASGQVTPAMKPAPPPPRIPPSAPPILDVIPVASRPPVMDAIVLPPVQPSAPILDVVPVTVEPVPVLEPTERPNIIARIAGGIYSVAGWLFGVFSLIVGLAILAAIPVIQFLALGYLLEVGGRVARTGRLRDGFIGVRKAARVGSIVLGTSIMLAPLYLVSALAVSAQLVDPTGPAARGWEIGLTVLTVFIMLHTIGAWSRGGRLHHFLWPSGNPIRLIMRLAKGEWLDVFGLIFFGNFYWLGKRLLGGGYYAEARDAVWDFVVSLRLPYYFWLGLRGFIGGVCWLIMPGSLLALGQLGPMIHFRGEIGQGLFLFLLVMLGWFLMSLVLLYVPFLMMHFAREKRLSAFLEIGAARADYRRAPVAFAFAFFVTLALSLPLYLLRIEQVPRDAGWMLTPFFVITIFPTKLLTGWACGRAQRRTTPRHWFFRWTCRPVMLATAAAYVFFLFFTQYIGGEGARNLYIQHAFLLPVPFMAFD
jgi:hypothetical protein